MSQEITFDHLRDYVAGLQARELAAKTVSDRVIILKRFFGYLLAEGRLTSDPAQRLPIPKVGKRLPKALTLAEVRAFFSTMSHDLRSARRDQVLFELMYGGGLRVSEVVGLRVEEIDFVDGSVRIIGKGNKERRVYLKAHLIKLVQEYIDLMNVSRILFPGRGGKAMTPRAVQRCIKKYARAAKISRPVTPHTLRHSIAVHYLQGGAPVNSSRDFWGMPVLRQPGGICNYLTRWQKRSPSR